MSKEFPEIPLSKRGFIFFIEHARIEARDGAAVYIKAENGRYAEYNLPSANTSMLLLGEGSSLTRDAARIIADNGCIICFVGGGGTPLVSATQDTFIALTPGDEYRPTLYMQKIARAFFDDEKRLSLGKELLKRRISLTADLWNRLPEAKESLGLMPADVDDCAALFRHDIEKAKSVMELLAAEGRYTKKIYAKVSQAACIDDFTRNPGDRSDYEDRPNRFLDHANYLAYGAAAVALHGLGISFAFAILHGKTRRGGLVFDFADLIKDGICLPISFFCASSGETGQQCRIRIIEAFHGMRVLDILFAEMKGICENA